MRGWVLKRSEAKWNEKNGSPPPLPKKNKQGTLGLRFQTWDIAPGSSCLFARTKTGASSKLSEARIFLNVCKSPTNFSDCKKSWSIDFFLKKKTLLQIYTTSCESRNRTLSDASTTQISALASSKYLSQIDRNPPWPPRSHITSFACNASIFKMFMPTVGMIFSGSRPLVSVKSVRSFSRRVCSIVLHG